jgi:hypothetical protein
VKLVRLAVATALGASALVGVQANAAAKIPCKLLTDVTKDATVEAGQFNDSSIDLTSADIAADKKKLVMVMRVEKASLKSAVLPVGTIKLTGYFTIGQDAYFASALSDGSKVTGNFGTAAKATGETNEILTNPLATIDLAKNEARVTVPLADFPFPYKVGAMITEISAVSSGGVVSVDTGVGVAANTGGLYSDTAEKAGATYKIGTKNCVGLVK